MWRTPLSARVSLPGMCAALRPLPPPSVAVLPWARRRKGCHITHGPLAPRSGFLPRFVPPAGARAESAALSCASTLAAVQVRAAQQAIHDASSPPPLPMEALFADLAKFRQWRLACLLFGHRLMSDSPLDAPTLHAALDACTSGRYTSRGARWAVAVRILEELRHKRADITEPVLSRAMESFVKDGQLHRCIAMLQLMRETGMPVTVQTFNAVLRQCAQPRLPTAYRFARYVWREMIAQEVQPSGSTHRYLLRACAACKPFDTAVSLLQRLREQAKLALSTRDYEALLACAARGRQWHVMLPLVGELRARGQPCTGTVYRWTLRACAELQDWETFDTMVDRLHAERVRPTHRLLATLARAYVQRGRPAAAVPMLRSYVRVHAVRPRPPWALCEHIGAACCAAEQWEAVLDVLALMQEFQRTPGPHMWAFAARAYLGQGLAAEAQAALARAAEMDVQHRPCVPLFHARIHQCALQGDWQGCIQLLDTMAELESPKRRPDPQAYGLSVWACAQAGQHDVAWSLFQHMIQAGVVATPRACRAVLQRSAQDGRADRAVVAVQQLVRAAHALEVEDVGLLVRAVAHSGDGDSAFDMLAALRDAKAPFDAAVYETALRAALRRTPSQRGAQVVRGVLGDLGKAPGSLLTAGIDGAVLADARQFMAKVRSVTPPA